jgi:hypothetical protein
VVSPKTSEYSGEAFYRVQVAQLRELRRPGSLTYLGSDERFHYLRVWNKVVREGEVQYVALRKRDCQVADEASIDSELAYRKDFFSSHPWRKVSVDGVACSVPPRIKFVSAHSEK